MPLLARFIIVFVIVLLAFSASRDALARFVWEEFRNAPVALALVSRDETLPINIGGYFFNGGAYDLSLAEHAYRIALKIKPGILLGHYQLARIHFVNGKFNLALQELEEELRHNPGNLRSLYVRGLVYAYRGMSGDLELSEKDFRTFVEWAPTEWAGYNDLAWVLIRQEKYEEAVKVTDEAFAKAYGAAENPWLWNMNGVAELNLRRYDFAQKSFARALKHAKELSGVEWQKAYPGNAPMDAIEGLRQFLDSIEENLKKTTQKI